MILLFGGGGQLGRELSALAQQRSVPVSALAVCGKTRQRQGRMIHFPM